VILSPPTSRPDLDRGAAPSLETEGRVTIMRSPTAILCVLLGCGSSSPTKSDSAAPKEGAGTMKLESSAFAANESIPSKYTCKGDDLSPPLSWSDVPDGTKSFALIVDDPDAPDPAAPKRVWVHWVVYDLPAGTTSLREGASTSLPGGAKTGKNDWGKTAWGGPCPPIGRHRYFHKIYALDTTLDLSNPDKKALEQAMEGHILAQAELVGTYQAKD
jgi:hypothetical protein